MINVNQVIEVVFYGDGKDRTLLYKDNDQEKEFKFKSFKVNKLCIIFFNNSDTLQVDCTEFIKTLTGHCKEFLKMFGMRVNSVNMKIIQMFLRGYKQKDIASELRVSESKVSTWLRSNGLTKCIPFDPILKKEEVDPIIPDSAFFTLNKKNTEEWREKFKSYINKNVKCTKLYTGVICYGTVIDIRTSEGGDILFDIKSEHSKTTICVWRESVCSYHNDILNFKYMGNQMALYF